MCCKETHLPATLPFHKLALSVLSKNLNRKCVSGMDDCFVLTRMTYCLCYHLCLFTISKNTAVRVYPNANITSRKISKGRQGHLIIIKWMSDKIRVQFPVVRYCRRPSLRLGTVLVFVLTARYVVCRPFPEVSICTQ